MPTNAVVSNTDNQWITFQIHDAYYALPVAHTREILPYTEPNPVPGSSSDVLGMLNIRNEVMTIFSGALMLSKEEEDARDHIIVLETQNGNQGMVVSNIGRLITFEPQHIQQDPTVTRTEFVIGTIRQDEQLYILLDLNNEFAGQLQ